METGRVVACFVEIIFPLNPERHLSPALLSLRFPLTLSWNEDLVRGTCPAACRRQDSGADEFATLWCWLLAKPAGSMSLPSLCPKLEPLIERPATASSY